MKCLLLVLLSSLSLTVVAKGKILATPGVSQIEGSAGGGLVPWAQLAAYATEDEISAGAFCSRASVDDFRLHVCGAQLNFYDRFEISFAEQEFDVNPLSLRLEQSIIGAKVRLYGDLVYSAWPQISMGIQYKTLDTSEPAFALGAKDNEGADVYLAASKLHLGAIAGYNWLWNVTLRHTEANQNGLLGFGGSASDGKLFIEASSAILLSKRWAVGLEYRQKPDNLNLGEDDWMDIFVAWFPNKHVSLTGAYLDLGSIAGIDKQTGWYFSMTGYF